MIETKEMTVGDFISLMSENSEIYHEFDKLPMEAKEYLAKFNIMTGTAVSYFEDGELIGVGGIRYVGIGEGWMITKPKIRDERKYLLFRQAKKEFDKTKREKNLWRVFSETRISKLFLRHLGFIESEIFVWTGL